MPETVGIISLGCPKNLVDTEIMLGLLERAGYRIVSDPHKAGIIIVNTCSFIEDAKRESIETILEMAGLKRNHKATRLLIVTGCLPQRYKEEIVGLFPEVDMFIGTGEYHQIVHLIKRLKKRTTKTHERPDAETSILNICPPEYIHTCKTPRKLTTPAHAVYVKIAEGCFHNCSFCAIPRMRGRYRSREVGDIVSEVNGLIRGGAREINLIAQDTTAYGHDLESGDDIVTLVSEIAKVSGEKWIRFLYAYPQSFKKGIVKLMKETKEICRYIDLPIQHIDDTVLHHMRRGRSERMIRSLIEYIRKELPDTAIRTTVIAGFPGETEGQFKKLLRFIEEGWFDHLGAFSYSEEEGTVAANMKGHLPQEVKYERRDEIMKVQRAVSRKRLEEKVGKKLKVLVESMLDDPHYHFQTRLPAPCHRHGGQARLPAPCHRHGGQARTEYQAPDIDGVTYINEGRANVGGFYWVQITGSSDYDLVGRLRG